MSRYRGRRENSFIGLFLDMDTLINRHRQASLRRCDMERLAMTEGGRTVSAYGHSKAFVIHPIHLPQKE